MIKQKWPKKNLEIFVEDCNFSALIFWRSFKFKMRIHLLKIKYICFKIDFHVINHKCNMHKIKTTFQNLIVRSLQMRWRSYILWKLLLFLDLIGSRDIFYVDDVRLEVTINETFSQLHKLLNAQTQTLIKNIKTIMNFACSSDSIKWWKLFISSLYYLICKWHAKAEWIYISYKSVLVCMCGMKFICTSFHW